MKTTTSKARQKAVGEVKDLVLNDARGINGGKKTAAQRQVFEKYVRDNEVTQDEYWSVN
jgi:hypothetical protein